MGEYKHTVKTTCKFCRQAFQSFGLKKVCPTCDQNMNKYFQEIKAYIEEFPHATVAEICSDLGIPTALIKYYLREERLEIKNNNRNYFLKCEKCNKAIQKGRYCFECEITVTRAEMESVSTQDSEHTNMEKAIARFHSNKLSK